VRFLRRAGERESFQIIDVNGGWDVHVEEGVPMRSAPFRLASPPDDVKEQVLQNAWGC